MKLEKTPLYDTDGIPLGNSVQLIISKAETNTKTFIPPVLPFGSSSTLSWNYEPENLRWVYLWFEPKKLNEHYPLLEG